MCVCGGGGGGGGGGGFVVVFYKMDEHNRVIHSFPMAVILDREHHRCDKVD